jgi:hypothetical protein
MKDQHIACVHAAAYPPVSYGCLDWNLRDMQIFSLMALNAETMRALQNPQRTYIYRTVM